MDELWHALIGDLVALTATKSPQNLMRHGDPRIGSLADERLDSCDRVASIWHLMDLGLDAFGATPIARIVEHRSH